MKRTMGIWIGLICVLAGAGWRIWSNERILTEGRVVLLELAPIDPRSLMQGDFMSLNYALSNALRRELAREDGYAVVRLDSRGVASIATNTTTRKSIEYGAADHRRDCHPLPDTQSSPANRHKCLLFSGR
jgi:uncharacterized membrane-anchored protein